MQRRSLGSWSVVLVGWLGSACGGGQVAPVTGPAGAAGTAAAALVVFAAAGGCKLQGCPYGSYCNAANGLCESKTCAAGCPSGKMCNEGLDRCQDAPKPKTPNDFLPVDDKIGNPLGTH